ncbi:hypothetical protein [Corynebacterium kalidii]|uniref:Uncharacterized protein n=1 Tax=Corynebacterium kalidii TaxID=2931982 RepID=A0A9X2AY40_9CORY|nr:hypothetical protein [Corynebacterium kalidii]MCJ7857681.1 hypothetical protein [Corynebacterium kalidii]
MTTIRPATLSMQAISDLAQVKRPVVSLWRSRYAESDTPFPSPVQTDPLRFDASEVADWLERTGRGNNRDAAAENPLHADLRERLFATPDDTSALLLLAHLLGEPLDDYYPEDLPEVVSYWRVEPVLSVQDVEVAVARTDISEIDTLVEAAFSASATLDLLVASFGDRDGAWAPEALTVPARHLVGSIIAEVFHDRRDRRIVPAGPGGMTLLDAALEQFAEQDSPVVDYRTDALSTPADRAAWRRLLARDLDVSPYMEDRNPLPFTLDDMSYLHIFQWQCLGGADDFLDRVEDIVMGLGVDDVLVVVGPASAMIDADEASRRRRLLTPREGHSAPLRYCAELPKGMSRFGGRRRLALWVFAPSMTEATVIGTHGGHRLDDSLASSLAADVVVSTSDREDIFSHAFRTSRVLATERFVTQEALTSGAELPETTSGGDSLARVWELQGDVLDGVTLEASDAHPRRVSFGSASTRYGKDMAGHRIPADELTTPGPGTVVVWGAPEIRSTGAVDSRAINRLTLEQVAPQTQFTEPGDVVYVTARGEPAAIVDRAGGHVVEYPARVFRCGAPDDGLQLLPEVVTADINAEQRKDRKSWQLRLTPTDRAPTVTETVTRLEQRRDQLYEQLSRLNELQTTLIDGLSSGALREADDHSDN